MTSTRTIATKSIDDLGGSTSVLARQRRDHQELNDMLDELEAAAPDGQPALLRRIWRLAFRHAFAEEAVLWPALRRFVDGSDALTLQVEEEHQAISTLAVELESMGPADEAWSGTVAAVVQLLRADTRDEEDLLLPRLQDVLDGHALRRLGATWGAVRRVAPTRPHPVVSRRPPGNVLAAVPLSALDRARDGLDAVADRFDGRVGSGVAASASGLLASVTGLVERMPPLRRGERSKTRVD